MTLRRVPVFSWSIMVSGAVLLLALPILIGAFGLLFVDRHYGASLFSGFTGSRGGNPLVWPHDGEIEFFVGETTTVGQRDTFVLVPGGVAHTFGNAATTPARLLVIHAPAMDAYFEELQALWSGDIPPTQDAEMELMRRHGMEPAGS